MSRLEVIGMTVAVIVVAALFVGFGHMIYQEDKRMTEYYNQELQRRKDMGTDDESIIKLCIDKGGIPERSGWNGRLKECHFSTEVTE